MKKTHIIASLCMLSISITSAKADIVKEKSLSERKVVKTKTNARCPVSTEDKCVVRLHTDGDGGYWTTIDEELVHNPVGGTGLNPEEEVLDFSVDPGNPEQAVDDIEAILVTNGELQLLEE